MTEHGACMKFWVTTPSYNQLEWLKLCVASVADQIGEGLEVHHHVQDGQSSDGTVEWLEAYEARNQSCDPTGYSFSYESVPDEGMYDAINRGWERSGGQHHFISYLNCDEQYLEGGLSHVRDTFLSHPSTEVVFANLLILDIEGRYICHRRGLMPRTWSVPFVGPCPTAVTFLRSDVFFEKKCRFDMKWKAVGDLVWYNDLMSKKVRTVMCKEATSIYTMMESNLSNTNVGREEGLRYDQNVLGMFARLKPIVKKANLIRRLLLDIFHASPRSYSIYRTNRSSRKVYQIRKATSVWGRK